MITYGTATIAHPKNDKRNPNFWNIKLIINILGSVIRKLLAADDPDFGLDNQKKNKVIVNIKIICGT